MTDWSALATDAISRSGTEPAPKLVRAVADAMMAVALVVQADPSAYGVITNGDIANALAARREPDTDVP